MDRINDALENREAWSTFISRRVVAEYDVMTSSIKRKINVKDIRSSMLRFPKKKVTLCGIQNFLSHLNSGEVYIVLPYAR